VSDEELLLLRTAALLHGMERRSVVLALAEATTVISEITAVPIRGIDDEIKPTSVHLSGTSRHLARHRELTRIMEVGSIS